MSNDKSIKLEDWWADWQKSIVQDRIRKWVKKTFKSSAGFQIPSVDGSTMLGKIQDNEKIPPGAIIKEGAWDHEHCDLCWETISEHGSDQHEGYTDGKDWLCNQCYQKYIHGSE